MSLVAPVHTRSVPPASLLRRYKIIPVAMLWAIVLVSRWGWGAKNAPTERNRN